MNHNLLRVSSDFKQAGISNSNSDFYQCYNNCHAIERVTKVVMKSCDIPNVFYNINDKGYNFQNTGNNQWLFTNNANEQKTIIIPVGQYTLAELINFMNAALTNVNGTGGAVQVQQNPTTKKLEYITNVPGYKFSQDQCTILKYLGFSSPSVWQYNATLAAQSFVNLSGISEVYVTSQKLADSSNMIVAESTVYPVILNVQMNVPFGEIEHYNTNHFEIDDIIYPSSEGTTIRQLDIQLRDRFGNILDIGELPFNLIIKIYHGELS